MRRYSLHIPVLGLLLLFVSGCVIKNTMDYPLVPGRILAFQVEGQKRARIDADARTVQIELDETAEITSLRLDSLRLSEGTVMAPAEGTYASFAAGDRIDLSQPVRVLLKTYQDYVWTLSAVQPIERYITCDHQVGEAQFNADTRTALVYVTVDQPLSSLRITSMKLGPAGSVVERTTGRIPEGLDIVEKTEEVSFPMVLDCVLDRSFYVTFGKRSETWTFKALQTDVPLEITSVDVRCYHAGIRGIFNRNLPPAVEFRKATEAAWTRLPSDETVVAGVGISAVLKGLVAGTDYLVRLSREGESSPEYAFRTDPDIQLDNMDFDSWWLDGKTWYPYSENAAPDRKIWDSANKATAAFIGSATTPEDEFVAVPGPGKKAAKLSSSYAVVKFASATLFTGSFVGLKGLGAELSWGIPFSSRPIALHGYYSYAPKKIDHTDDSHASLKGKNDIGQIQVLLTDWAAPFRVVSNEGRFVDTAGDPAIIGYACLEDDRPTAGYKEFTLPITYRYDRVPKWIVIVAASSRYGDYFTGAEGSILHVDEFSLQYD